MMEAAANPPTGSSGKFLTNLQQRPRLTTPTLFRTKIREKIQAPARSSTNVAVDRVGSHHRDQRPESMITLGTTSQRA